MDKRAFRAGLAKRGRVVGQEYQVGAELERAGSLVLDIQEALGLAVSLDCLGGVVSGFLVRQAHQVRVESLGLVVGHLLGRAERLDSQGFLGAAGRRVLQAQADFRVSERAVLAALLASRGVAGLRMICIWFGAGWACRRGVAGHPQEHE